MASFWSPAKVDPQFKKELKDIKLSRIKAGKDEILKSDRRLTEGIRRHNFWPTMKRDLINSELPERNRRGQIQPLVLLLVLIAFGFLITLFFVGWTFAHATLTSDLVALPTTADGTDLGDLAQQTFGEVDIALGQLQSLAWIMFFSVIVGMFITNYLIKVHPVYFVIYLFITVVAIIMSVLISNAYEPLLLDSAIGSTLSEFGGMNFVYLHLPIFTTVIGFLGMMFLLIGATRDRESGGRPV